MTAVSSCCLTLTLSAVLLCLMGCSTAPSEAGPLKVETPVGWKLKYSSEGLDFYSLQTSDKGVFMFSRWPPPSKPSQMQDWVKQIAESFAETLTSSNKLSSVNYELDDFAGTSSKGSYAVFDIKMDGEEFVQTVFMMDVGGFLWSGQFTGSSNSWNQAVDVLKTIRNR
jgi:hypothetical protein